jgi:hypothetical protein
MYDGTSPDMYMACKIVMQTNRMVERRPMREERRSDRAWSDGARGIKLRLEMTYAMEAVTRST